MQENRKNKQQNIFEEYDIIDRIVKSTLKEIPVERHEIIYLLELEKQSKIYLLLFGIGICLSGVIILISL
jgi:hypothetical protein